MTYSMRFPMRIDATGKIAKASTPYERDLSRIIFAVGTNVSERVMYPTYGNDILKAYYLTDRTIESAITDAIAQCFADFLAPLELVNVTVTPNDDGSIQTADISWRRPGASPAQVSTGTVDVSGAVTKVEE